MPSAVPCAVHCWADYQAAVDMRARSASSLRRQIAESGRSSRRQRRFSAGFTAATPKTDAAMQRAATLFEPLEMQLRRYSIGSLAESVGGGFLTSMSKNLDSLLGSSLSMSLDESIDSQSSAGAGKSSQQKGKAKRLNYQGVQEEELDEDNVGKTGDQRYVGAHDIMMGCTNRLMPHLANALLDGKLKQVIAGLYTLLGRQDLKRNAVKRFSSSSS